MLQGTPGASDMSQSWESVLYMRAGGGLLRARSARCGTKPADADVT